MSEQNQPYTTTPPPSKREELENGIYDIIRANIDAPNIIPDIHQATLSICDLISTREKELREEVRRKSHEQWVETVGNQEMNLEHLSQQLTEACELFQTTDAILSFLMVHHEQVKPVERLRERIANFLTQSKTTDDGTK